MGRVTSSARSPSSKGANGWRRSSPLTEVLVEVISRTDFRVLLEDHPQIDAKLRAALAERLSENAANKSGTT